MKQLKQVRYVLVALAVMASAYGCVASKQARSATASGFLGDYSMMRPGQDGQALLVYVAPDAQWDRYRSVIIDPIRVYAASDAGVGDLSREELQSIVNYFDAAVRKQLGKSYRIVSEPQADTLRVRIALTDAQGSSVLLDTLSNVLPPATAISALKEAITGSGTGVGRAGVESELADAMTGRRLGAAVDARVGGKTFEGKLDKWDDVKSAIDYWAERLANRLAEERAAAK